MYVTVNGIWIECGFTILVVGSILNKNFKIKSCFKKIEFYLRNIFNMFDLDFRLKSCDCATNISVSVPSVDEKLNHY